MSRRTKPVKVQQETKPVKEEKKPVLVLTGVNGNAFNILGIASRVARENNLNWGVIVKEATAGDYDHLLQVMMKHFDVE